MPVAASGVSFPDHQPSGASEPSTGLVLVSTPIGNLADITIRARAALAAADLVLCEDTRRTGQLLRRLGLAPRLQALHEHNEDAATPAVLTQLACGACVVLVSDAGTPLVSDPGFRLTRAAIAAGAKVTALPGPNAALTALVLSGLPPLPFLVLGFPPPRAAARRSAFGRLLAAERAGLAATLIWHEAPHRLADTLADLVAMFGPRPAAVARELTKRFEEVRRGPLPELADWYASHPARGEITVLVGPAPSEAEEPWNLDAQLRAALEHHSVKDAAALVAGASGLPRKLIYTRALELAERGTKMTPSSQQGGASPGKLPSTG
jgi:16S rRNA (cytidine1402-2'-O)-methyltransferase